MTEGSCGDVEEVADGGDVLVGRQFGPAAAEGAGAPGGLDPAEATQCRVCGRAGVLDLSEGQVGVGYAGVVDGRRPRVAVVVVTLMSRAWWK